MIDLTREITQAQIVFFSVIIIISVAYYLLSKKANKKR